MSPSKGRTMSNSLLRAAEDEAAKLRAELEKSPVYRQLQAVEKFIADYRTLERAAPQPLVGNIAKAAKYGRQGSVSATVIEAAEAYLRQVGRRAMSGEIMTAISDRVTVPGKTPTSTLSSYLSTSDLFDNVKGEGYGLKEWRTNGEDESKQAALKLLNMTA